MNLIALTCCLLSATPINVKFEGTLSNALKEIAEKGELNVLVQGELNQSVSVRLNNVDAQEALASVAKSYGLALEQQGSLMIVKVPAASIDAPARVTPLSKLSGNENAAELESQAQVLRDQAESLRDQQEELEEARREKREALSELVEAHKEATKAEIETQDQNGLHRVSTGGAVTVEKSETVDTAVSYGGPVIIEEHARVRGDAVAFGGDVILKDHAIIEGDAVSFGGRVVRGKHSTVNGEVVMMGSSSFGSAVAKNALRTQQVVDEARDENDSSFGSSVAWFLVNFALLFGLGFVLALFVPDRMKMIDASIRREPLANGMTGALALIMFLPAVVILCITLIGIPVALFLVMAGVLAVFISTVLIANIVGSRMPTGHIRKTQALVLSIGVMVTLLVKAIPYLGGLIFVVGLAIAIGALLRTRFGTGSGLASFPTIDMNSSVTS